MLMMRIILLEFWNSNFQANQQSANDQKSEEILIVNKYQRVWHRRTEIRSAECIEYLFVSILSNYVMKSSDLECLSGDLKYSQLNELELKYLNIQNILSN
jgi:hypothetical protein